MFPVLQSFRPSDGLTAVGKKFFSICSDWPIVSLAVLHFLRIYNKWTCNTYDDLGQYL